MKTFILAFLAIIFSNAAFAQNWTQVAPIPGPGRDAAISFVINGKIYVGGGYLSTGTGGNDLYEYNPSTNTWAAKANMPDYLWAVGSFVVNGKGYVVSGADNAGLVASVYQYDPVLDQWSIKNNFPGPSRQDGFGFAISDTGYIFAGFPGGTELNDLWAYNPTTDSWAQKASMPSVGRSSVKGFILNNIVYVGLGEYNSSANYANDIGAYNPATNTWSVIAQFPGHLRAGQSAFTIGKFGYVGLGAYDSAGVFYRYNDYFRYNADSNNWVNAGNFPGAGRGNDVVQNVGDIVYVGSGINSIGTFYTDWWRFVYQVTVNMPSGQTVCNGSHIILNPTVSGAIPPIVYSWSSTGDSLSCYNCANPAVNLTQTSTYFLTVKDANNSLAYDTVTYTVSGTSSTIQASLTNTNISCPNPVDTSTAIITNATAPLTFLWGDGSSGTGVSPGVHTYSQAGVYVFSVSDSSGCVTSVLDTVQNFAVAVSIAGVVPPICLYDSTGKIIVTATGGTPPYTYIWTTGSTTDSATNLPAGDYSVTVTDVTSCSTQFFYGLNPANDVWDYYVNLTVTNPNCTSNGAITTVPYGGIQPYHYHWNIGATTAAVQSLGAGNYVVTVTDSSGCPRKATATLNYNCASIISGYVFIDTNQNCIFDAGEVPVSYDYLTAQSLSTGNVYFGSSDRNGLYTIVVQDTGTYNLQISNYGGTCANFTLCGNAGQNITLSVLGDSSVNNNFATSVSSGFDLTIHPGWTSANPGFQKEYWVMPYNQGFIPFTGLATLVFQYDPNLIYQYTYAPAPRQLPTWDSVGHTLTWLVDSMPFPSWDWYGCKFENFFLVPATLPLGYLLQSSFSISPLTGDCDTTNNSLHFSETVIGSHDPNEKTVVPAGQMPETDSILTYTIHFQNSGTDSTHFIVVVDTLSPLLDPASVRTVASSHPYSKFSISGKGILTWEFNPLRLVDSIRNPQGSKGFVSFQVKKKANLPTGTRISNTATIYFDYNDGVVTNTVSDTVYTKFITSVAELKPAVTGISVMAFPNPFANTTNIMVTGLNEKYDFELFDVTGRLMKKITSIQNSQFQVNSAGIASGVYMYRISVSSKPMAYGKLVVE